MFRGSNCTRSRRAEVFTEPVYAMLCADPVLVGIASERLLYKYFPEHLRDFLRDAFELLPPRFDEKVLHEYDCRCSICGSVLRVVKNEPITPKVSHIQWAEVGGPDEICNRLALCDGHRSAFNWGAIGLEESGSNFHMRISSELKGLGPLLDFLLLHENQPIRSPAHAEHKPASKYVEWHREHVFHGVPRRTGA